MAETLTIEQGLVLATRYELIQRIATGGMAQVWIANDSTTNQSVAIKLLHQHLATDEGFRSRFKREALRAKQLEHKSIVNIIETIEDPINAIVMEYIEGRDLREVMDSDGPLFPKKVMDIGVEIAAALNVAHDSGIIHRDIKPANIMLQKSGPSVITDFGIAKATGDLDLTETGSLLGTAKYVAPEQINGGTVDASSDLYSLAIVLYEALTGETPFNGGTDTEIALARLQTVPTPPSELRPDLDLGYDHFFKKALATNPNARYKSAKEFIEAARKTSAGTYVPRPSLQGFMEDDDEFTNHHISWRYGVIGCLVFVGSLILAIWLLVISITGFGNSNGDDRPITLAAVSILDADNDILSRQELSRAPTNIGLPSTQSGQSILLELNRQSEISQVAINATGQDWVVSLELFGIDDRLNEPIVELMFDNSTTIELSDSVDAKFALIEFRAPENGAAELSQVILN